MKTEYDVVVVGSGPNGLAAAIVAARHGRSVAVFEAHGEVGGGTRTAELTIPGVAHDVCSAAHPFGAGSPFLQSIPLEDHGLRWQRSDVPFAHPLDNGRGAGFFQSIERTSLGLGVDGARWQSMFGRVGAEFDRVAPTLLGPPIRVPHPSRALVDFAKIASFAAVPVAKRFGTDEAQALFIGAAAHAIHPLERVGTAAVGGALIAAGHAYGWPVAEGGSHNITLAMASYLRTLGGVINTGQPIRSLSDLPTHHTAFFDTSPRAVVQIMGDRLPARTRRAYERFKSGPGAFKLDLAIEGNIEWTNDLCRLAGVVHVGGTAAEIATAEREVHAGEMPERPFVLVGQQYLADPSRSAGNINPIWMYAHVPHGWDGDATEAILAQMERFAPGFRERIVATSTMNPSDFEAYNANYIGGDIAAGAASLEQIVFRPVRGLDPYSTGVTGYYLCSASTSPGAGVHGMCGYHAARTAFRNSP